MRVGDEAGVLVPPKRHAALGGLDNVLLVAQVDGVPERCLRGLRLEIGEQEPLDRGALAVGMDELAAAAVKGVQRLDPEAAHLVVAFVDEALALGAQGLEIVRGTAPLRRRSPRRESACVCGGEARSRDSPAVSFSRRPVTTRHPRDPGPTLALPHPHRMCGTETPIVSVGECWSCCGLRFSPSGGPSSYGLIRPVPPSLPPG
jgi:hypothetical protein